MTVPPRSLTDMGTARTGWPLPAEEAEWCAQSRAHPRASSLNHPDLNQHRRGTLPVQNQILWQQGRAVD
jgi:hypothetical protein